MANNGFVSNINGRRNSDRFGCSTTRVVPLYAKQMLSHISGAYENWEPFKQEFKCIRGKEHKKPNKKGLCPECGDLLITSSGGSGGAE